MNRITGFLCSMLCLLVCGVSLSAELGSVLNTDLDLKTLYGMSEEELTAYSGTRVLLTGTVADRVVINNDPDSWAGQIELVEGEWENTLSLQIYRVFIDLQGGHWADRVPARGSSRSGPDHIVSGSLVIVIGRLLDPYLDEQGNVLIRLQAEFIRTM